MQALSKVFLPLVLIAAYSLNVLTTCLLPEAIIDGLNHHICILTSLVLLSSVELYCQCNTLHTCGDGY